MEKQVRKAIIRYLKKHFPGEEKEIIEDLYTHLKWAGFFLNTNRKPVLSALRKYLYKSYTKYAEMVRQKQSQGADSCDYWYVPDKSRTAEEYKGIIV